MPKNKPKKIWEDPDYLASVLSEELGIDVSPEELDLSKYKDSNDKKKKLMYIYVALSEILKILDETISDLSESTTIDDHFLYFDEINALSNGEKVVRADMASTLEKEIKKTFSKYRGFLKGYDTVFDFSRFKTDFDEIFWQWLILFADEDFEYSVKRSQTFADEITQSTMNKIKSGNKKGIEWCLSDERAKAIASNETQNFSNALDHDKAVKSGKKYKTWVTQRDEKVRTTHNAVNNVTIPIGEYFTVGNSKMLYPMDTSMDASPDEIINCRCVCVYK